MSAEFPRSLRGVIRTLERAISRHGGDLFGCDPPTEVGWLMVDVCTGKISWGGHAPDECLDCVPGDDDEEQSVTLYRLFNRNLRLLYVGIAGNPGRRFSQHASDKFWWGEVVDVRLIHYPTREEARVAEIQAIRSENPLYNIADRARGRA